LVGVEEQLYEREQVLPFGAEAVCEVHRFFGIRSKIVDLLAAS
jgi:hypothetical protein